MTDSTNIAQLGDDVLRAPAQQVDNFNCSRFLDLLDTLQQQMLSAGGVGIAAPQIGISLQVIIIASRPSKRYPNAPDMQPLVMVNPTFEITDHQQVKDWEGCLSVPGIRALVPRYRAVQVSYQDSLGQPQQLMLKDFPARIFQHEFDHLLGMVYLDRVENNRDIIAESEFFKRIAA